ncbi:MAG: hypothetical protein ACKOZL_00380 [Actinomycetes bacterium]
MESELRSLASSGVSRRQVLARSAVAAGVVWAAPVVRTASAYAATSAGTSRPCTQFYVAGLSLTGNWYPAYPYGFVPSLQVTENLEGTAPTTTTTTVPLAMTGTPTRRTDTGPRKLTRRELAAFLADTTTDTTDSNVTVPKLIEEWVRENPSVPLLEPDVYPQITQTGAPGWAVLLPEVTGPNAPARQPRFILGYSWQGSHYAYGYVDPQPANPVLAGRRILFPSPVGREPGVGDEPTTTTNDPRPRRRRSTTTSSSTSSTTTTSRVAPTTATTKPGSASFGPAPSPSTTNTSTTTTSSTTTTTTLPPTTTTSTTTPPTTTTLPPTTTTTRPGWGKGGSKATTTTTTPPTTTTSSTTTTSTTTTTIPTGDSTTTTTTTGPGGTTTTTTDPMSLWWITANSSTGSTAWDALVPRGTRTVGANGAGATTGRGTGSVDTGVGPAGPAGPGALSPTDSRSFADYFAPIDGEGPYDPPQGSPIKGVILIYCQP